MNQIPVSELFLFNHGMGYLVRKGAFLISDAEIQKISFKIKNTEINDILKSLLLQFPNCIITDINFTTPTLEETRFELSEQDTLSSFIEHNKGVPVVIELENSQENIEGRLLLVQDENEESHVPKSMSIMTDKGLKSIAVKNIKNLHIKDEKLVKELQKVLFNYTWDKDKEREIIISFKPNNELKSTEVSIGYLIQMPVWKVSYRLRILSENDIRISGWVVVENETTDNWNQINLKLISGNPISFIYDQDTLIQLERSDFTPEPPKASGPVIAQASLEAEARPEEMAPGSGMKMKRHMMSLSSTSPQAPPPPSAMPMMKSMMVGAEPEMYFDEEKVDDFLADAIGAIQETDKDIQAGSDYYVFDITSKITIPAKEKSLIPLINEAIEGETVLYHKNTISNPSPYQAVELLNNTNFPFEQGPVTVFSEVSPIGQTILEKLNVGDRRILTYALEDRMRLQYDTEIVSYSEYRYDFEPERKLLVQRRFKYLKLEIRIINFLNESKKLIVDFLPNEEIDLIEESIPKGIKIETRENIFRIELFPKEISIEKYTISFKKELFTSINFESLDKKLVMNIPPEDMDDLTKEKIIAFIEYQNKNRLLIQEINKLRTRMNTILTDEDRIQKNIMSLSERKEDDRARNNFIVKLDELFNEYINLQKEEEQFVLQQKDLQTEMQKILDEMKK